MTWLALLLADRSACLRALALRELVGLPADDPELVELEALRLGDPLVSALLALQQADGSWGASERTVQSAGVQATAQALTALGFLGLGAEQPAVARGAAYLFGQQCRDGSWPLERYSDAESPNEGYRMVPLQTALPLRALAVCGYAQDPRAERAYEWLLAQRLADGAWPTGLAGGGNVYGGVAGYRRLPHSRWGCRSNTTGALLALAHHPQRRQAPEAKRALDLLLGRETRERQFMGYEVARLVGAEPTRGFLTRFARFDLALLLDLCARIGASTQDPRVADLVAFVQQAQGPYGLWTYEPHPQVSRWLTLDLLRALSRLDAAGEWLSTEPRTPFQPYGRATRRW
jgi:hypothetical protein